MQTIINILSSALMALHTQRVHRHSRKVHIVISIIIYFLKKESKK